MAVLDFTIDCMILATEVIESIAHDGGPRWFAKAACHGFVSRS